MSWRSKSECDQHELATLLFRLALFPLAISVSKKYGDRTFIRRLMKDLDGKNLSGAQDFLASLREFGTLRDF
jgi:hypothetical protein